MFFMSKVFRQIVTLLICFQFYTMEAQIPFAIEAESATLSNSYQLVANDNASNGSFVKLLKSAPAGSIEISVESVPSSGSYLLEILTFNGGSSQNLDLAINEGISNSIVLEPSNWAFEGPAQSTFLEVDLVAGTNILKFTSVASTILLDKFLITQPYKRYYMSNDGNDDNTGLSEDAPWKTIEKLNTALAVAGNGGWVAPGDKILFKRGDVFYGHLLNYRSGTEDDWIEFSSYGNSNEDFPIISGSGGTIEGGDYFQAMSLTNCSYVLLNKIWIKNDRTDGSRYTYGEYSSFGVKIIANKWGGVSSNITFREVKVSDVFGLSIPPPSEFNSLNATGIRMEAAENEEGVDIAINDILIEECYFTNIGKAGVWGIHKGNVDALDPSVNRNKNIIVKNNTFYRTGGSGVILSKTLNGLVENNDFDETGYSNNSEPRLAGRGSGLWVWRCQNIIAQYNRSFGVKGPGDSYGMHIDFGNSNIIYQYNYSEESEGGFCEILGENTNCTYRFNVSVNDGYRDFHGNTLWVSDFAGTGVKISSDENYIYNNSIYLDKNYAPDITITGKNTYVYNNIFEVVNGEIGEHVDINIDAGSDLFVSNNLFRGNIKNEFKALDVNSQSGDPAYVNPGGDTKDDYMISEGSAAVNNGKSFPEPSFPQAGIGIFKDISTFTSVDVYGNSVDIVNKTPNIGACNAYNSLLGLSSVSNGKTIFTIYPNPVKEQLHVHLNYVTNEVLVKVYSVVGAEVYSGKRNVVDDTCIINLPEAVKNGIYYLKLESRGVSQTSQFILYR